MKRKILALSMFFMIICTSVNVQAAEKSYDSIPQYLIDYEPFQNLLLEHPDARMVDNKASYVLGITTKNSEGDILNEEVEVFSNLEDLEKCVTVNENEIVSYSIGHEEFATKEYSKMRVQLTMYKYSSSSYFVAFMYKWLTYPPTIHPSYQSKGVVGLALDTGLVMDGSSYAGRLSLVYGNGTSEDKTSDGALAIQPTGTQGIGYPVSFYSPKGWVTSAEGVISCHAYKQSPNIEYVSAYGEYADVGMTLDLDNFSVSIPAGISFNLATSKTPYSIQDALSLN